VRIPGDHIWRNATVQMRPAGGIAEHGSRHPISRGSIRLPSGRTAGYLAGVCIGLIAIAITALLAVRAAGTVSHRLSAGLGSVAGVRTTSGALLYTIAGDERAGIMSLSHTGGPAAVTAGDEQREAAVSSPDGSQIVFLHAACPRCSAGYELRDLSSGRSRVIGTAPTLPAVDRSTAAAAWANDGHRLVFTEKGLDAARSQIFLLDESDNTRRAVSPSDPEPQQSPVWGPDGHTVAYLAGGGRTIVTTVDVETGEFRRLNDRLNNASDLTWSPDDRYLALRHDGGLWLVDPGEQRQPPGEGWRGQPADGSHLRQRLHLQHARHDRAAREVAAQVPGLGIDVVAPDGVLTGDQLDDLVDQQERLAVGDDRLDAGPVERQSERLGHADAAASESTSARRMRARPRWAWHLTVPTGISSASAISS